MPQARDIIYIRAAPPRPLFIRFNGTYHPIVRFSRVDDSGQTEEYIGYELRLGDLAEIHVLKRSVRIELGYDSELTDEPKLAALGYHFA